MHMFTKVQQFPITGEVFSLNLSFHNDGDSNLENDDLIQNFLFPTQESKTWLLVVDFLFDNQGNQSATETDIVNIHAAYQTGKFLIAAEYTEQMSTAQQLMTNLMVTCFLLTIQYQTN